MSIENASELCDEPLDEVTTTALIPERYPQNDLFICDVQDASLKDIMQEMEHPFYSLTKKPAMQIRRYETKNIRLEVKPGAKGLATIYDKDILIYAISQIMAKLNNNEEVHPRVRINAHEYLMFTNRGTSGRDYQALCDSLDRLDGTRISTNIKTGDEEQFDTFGLIDSGSARRKRESNGRLLWIEVKLSDWVFNAINASEVLTLSRDYFRLRKPIERRIYEIARKHCGNQNEFTISLKLLLNKTGSQSPLRRFRMTIKSLVISDHLPDYHLIYDADDDQVIFRKRKNDRQLELGIIRPNALKTETYEKAKKFLTNDADVYQLENDWIEFWNKSGRPTLIDADKAFIGFCKNRYVSYKQFKKNA